MKRIVIVGAGFSGSVVARELAAAGLKVLVIDERDHLAGNCHSERCASTGIMVHKYGPHIFHTDNERVWNYVNAFTRMMPYTNRVRAVSGGQVYSLPINLHTINQVFGTAMSPSEARQKIDEVSRRDIADPQTFEEQALRFVGDKIYRMFFYGYTMKQWGVEPRELPASILKRLPLRFDSNENYFNNKFQGMPENGYTEIVAGILAHENIEVRLGCRYEDLTETFEHVVYTGPLDRYFNHSAGRLGYRTLDFERIDADGDFQGTAVMNYCDREVPFTRISEHKYFAPWEMHKFDKTVAFREFSRLCGDGDIPYYPIRLINDRVLLERYVAMAEQERGVTFVGRLATYAYLDMDVTIARAFETVEALLPQLQAGAKPPVFVHRPL